MRLFQVAVGAAFFTAFTGAALAGEAIEFEPGPSQSITMTMGASQAIRTPRPYASVQIIDPAVVDATAISDHRITLVPKAPGISTVSIYDRDSKKIGEIGVTVVRQPEAREAFVGSVAIHNHPGKLQGVTYYKCQNNGCVFQKEVQSELPTPQPPAYPTAEVRRTSHDPRTGETTTVIERGQREE